MNTGRFVFSQITDFFPERDFRRLVGKYDYKLLFLGPPVGSHVRTVHF